MTDSIEFLINVLLFVILFVAIIGPVQSAFKLGEFASYFLTACVSALGIIGIKQFLGGSIKVILLPYAAMAISILLTLLLLFIGKHCKRTQKRWPNYNMGKDHYPKKKKKPLKKLKIGL